MTIYPRLCGAVKQTAVLAAIWAVCAGTATRAAAQPPAPPASSPNTLVGIVLGADGQRMPDVDVFLRQTQQRTRTRNDGTFTFLAIENGKYDVSARILGYSSKNYRVTVGDNGGRVVIQMDRIAFSLPSVVTRADISGVSGIVADTGLKAMPDVDVQIIGTARKATTDSNGAFHIDVGPGQYLLSLKRAGYTRQTIGVSVPLQGGRKVAAWMVPQQGSPNARYAQNLFDMSQRLMISNAVWSKFFTREDMERLGATNIRQVANAAAMKELAPDCPVIVDGGPIKLPLWQLDVRDVEFIEVYTAKPGVPKVTSVYGHPTTGKAESTSRVATSPCGATVYAWMRR